MKVILSLFFCISCLTGLAQTHFQGIQISVDLPAGWKTVQEDYGLVILGHTTTPGMILLVEHGYNSEAGILQSISEGIQDEGVILAAEGRPEKLSNGTYAASLSGYAEGQSVKAPLEVGLSKGWNTGGVMVAALVREDLYNKSYDKLVHDLMNSVRYKPFASNTRAKEWLAYLLGSKLKSRSAYDTNTSSFDSYASAGSSSSTTIHLCPNGQFLIQEYSSSYYGGTGVSGDVSRSNTETSGLWSVLSIQNQILIRMVFEEGEIEYYPIRRENGYIISNDSRYTKDVSELCR